MLSIFLLGMANVSGVPLAKCARTMKVTLGTDFSGLETPRIALETTGFVVKQLFTCDSDPNCGRMAAALFGDAERRYEDVQREQSNQAPHVDLYVAGVCCQPWSSAGKHGGHLRCN